MLTFLITILAVTILLVVDRHYSLSKEPIKYTNLDWEICRDGMGYDKEYYGRIYTVIKNKVKTVYTTRNFRKDFDAVDFTRRIYHTMRTEYGLADISEDHPYPKRIDIVDLL